MLIFDAHLDLSMNAVEYNRDLTRSLAEVRQGEAALGRAALSPRKADWVWWVCHWRFASALLPPPAR